MSLLREIQASLMDPDQDIDPILLKLRFLASRLGSDPLAKWVRFESDGYPNEAELPDYRILAVTYTASTLGSGGSRMRNVPVPTQLVMKTSGDFWKNYECRKSVATIDSLISGAKDGSGVRIDASNLLLTLQGKFYPDDTIYEVTGLLSVPELVGIKSAIRSRLLELTIGLERETPSVTDITLGPVKVSVGAEEQQKVSQVTNNVINGNYTAISNSGVISGLMLSIVPKDADSVVSALVEKGMSEEEAQEFAKILAKEKPECVDVPFGAKAKAWVDDKVEKMASGAWNVSVAVAKEVLTEAALKFYDLK